MPALGDPLRSDDHYFQPCLGQAWLFVAACHLPDEPSWQQALSGQTRLMAVEWNT